MTDSLALLKPHFNTDDASYLGTLPDIRIEHLRGEQIQNIYQFIRVNAELYVAEGIPTVWDNKAQRDVPITEVSHPATGVVIGGIDSFRHGIVNLRWNGATIPPLTIAVYSDFIEFDYRVGIDWGLRELEALLQLLQQVMRMAPNAIVRHFHEGCDDQTSDFDSVWMNYQSQQCDHPT